MTPSELAAIRTRLQKAASGPWKVTRVRNHWPSDLGDKFTHPSVRTFRVPKRMYEIATQQVEADAEFMARARQDVPALLDEFDRLRSVVQKVRRDLQALIEQADPDCQLSLDRIAAALRREYLRLEPPDRCR